MSHYASTMLTTTSPRTPLPLLRELMAEDRAAGVPFVEAWRADVMAACVYTPSGRSWLRAILGTERAWRRAYEGADDALEPLDFASLMAD